MSIFDKFRKPAATQLQSRNDYHPQVYAFEHRILRDAAFVNDPALMEALNDKPTDMPLLRFWIKSEIFSRVIGEVKGEFSVETLQQGWTPFSEIKFHSFQRDGYTVHIITMPEPQEPPEAHFVAVVHKDGEALRFGTPAPSTRYLTLEKTITLEKPLEGSPPVFCEWSSEGSHWNYGEGPLPTVESFSDAVFAFLR